MAGWVNWADVQVATSSSIGKTVLESLWPEVVRVAQAQEWPAEIYVDRMLTLLSELILIVKRSESPVLDREEDLQAAVQAGELFANSNFHPTVLRFRAANDAIAWVMRYVVANPPPHRAFPAPIQQVIDNNAALARLLPGDEGRPGWTANELTFDLYMQWLYVTKPDEAVTTVLGNALIAYVSGMCKLGEMTVAWMNSRIRQIRREAQNPDLELSRQVCSHVWDLYGVAFRPAADQFGPFFTWLENQCTQKAMTRLFITAQQSAEQGCTVLNLVAEAQRVCDDFNWDRFLNPRVPAERAIHAELTMWAEDFNTMKDNPWIRFSGGAGRSPQMANVGYLSKQLLVRAHGHMSYHNYQGLDAGNAVIRHKVWIDRVVQLYIDHMAVIPGGVEHPVAKAAGERNIQPGRLFQGIRRPAAAVPNIAVPHVPAQPVQNIVQHQPPPPPGQGGQGGGPAQPLYPALNMNDPNVVNLQGLFHQLQLLPQQQIQQLLQQVPALPPQQQPVQNQVLPNVNAGPVVGQNPVVAAQGPALPGDPPAPVGGNAGEAALNIPPGY